jgi:hypothetical protein
VFADARLAKAVVDLLTRKAHIAETGEESWRFRHGLENRGDVAAQSARQPDARAN